jgi:hypothetical protein
MPCSGVFRRVALVRTDVLEERMTSIIKVTRIGEIRTTVAVTSNRNLRCLLRLLVIANVPISAIPCHPNDGVTFLRNVGS